MKVNKLLTLGVGTLLALGLASCGGNTSSTSSVADPASHIDDAVDYLYQIYREEPTQVTSNFKRVTLLKLDYGTYDVDWKLDIAEGGLEDAVTMGEEKDNFVEFVVEMSLEKATNFTLTATVSYEETSKDLTFNYTVPLMEPITIKELIETADTEKLVLLEGVVSAVNKVGSAGSFVLTDETGSIFSYDNADVTLGDRVQITGKYSEYSGFVQLAGSKVYKVLESDKLGTVLGDAGEKATTYDVEEIAADVAKLGSDKEKIYEKYSGKFLKLTGTYLQKNSSGYAGGYTEATGGSQVLNLYANSTIDFDPFLNKGMDVYGFCRGFGSSYITIQVVEIVNPGEAVDFSPAEVSTDPAENIALAAEALKEKYQNGDTLVDFTRITKLVEDYGTYNVDWKVTVAEGGDTNAVKMGTPANDEVKFTVTPSAEKATNYTLTATVSYEDTKQEVTFEHVVPQVVVAENIAAFVDAEVGNTYYQLTGVVSAVNSTADKEGAFVLADATGAVFSYDKAKVTLGDEVVAYAKRGENYDFPQMAGSIIKEVKASGKLAEITGTAGEKATETTVAAIKADLPSYESDGATVIEKYQGKFMKVTGGYAVASGNFVNLFEDAEGKTKIANLYANSGIDLKALSGKQVDVYGFARGVSKDYITIQITAIVEAGTAVEF